MDRWPNHVLSSLFASYPSNRIRPLQSATLPSPSNRTITSAKRSAPRPHHRPNSASTKHRPANSRVRYPIIQAMERHETITGTVTHSDRATTKVKVGISANIELSARVAIQPTKWLEVRWPPHAPLSSPFTPFIQPVRSFALNFRKHGHFPFTMTNKQYHSTSNFAHHPDWCPRPSFLVDSRLCPGHIVFIRKTHTHKFDDFDFILNVLHKGIRFRPRHTPTVMLSNSLVHLKFV